MSSSNSFNVKILMLIGAVIVFSLILSYDMSFKKIKLECMDGNCRVLNGQKVLDSFSYDDVRTCQPAVFRRYCRNSFSYLRRGRKCYYPELVMKDGRSRYLHYKFDSRYKSGVYSFCNKFKSNRNFVYQ